MPATIIRRASVSPRAKPFATRKSASVGKRARHTPARRNFSLAAAVLFLSMLNIMTLLLYYNLFAQAPQGLGYSAIRAGLSLLPLSLALRRRTPVSMSRSR